MKRKRLSKHILTALFSAAMVVGLGIPVMAEAPKTPTKLVTQSILDVNKFLTVGNSEAVPMQDSFTFDIQKYAYTPADENITYGIETATGVTTVDATTVNATLPDIKVGGATVAGEEDATSIVLSGFGQASAPTVATNVFSGYSDTTRVSKGVVKSTSTVTAQQLSFDFSAITKPGVYTYKITEKTTAPVEPGLTYDTKVYYVDFYVVNQVYLTAGDAPAGATPSTVIQGEPTGALTIKNITIWQNKNGNLEAATDMDNPDTSAGATAGASLPTTPADQYVPGTTTAGKDNLVPDTSATYDPITQIGTLSTAVSFVNDYRTQNLALSKQVTGNYASKDKYFKYKVVITGDGSSTTQLKEYVVDYTNATAPTSPASNNIFYSGDNKGTATGTNNVANPAKITGHVAAPATADQYVYLKHNESITIKGLPVGAAWKLEEAGVEGYEASYTLTATGMDTSAGGDVGVATEGKRELGTDTAEVGETLTKGGSLTYEIPVSEINAGKILSADMSMAYINNRTYITPTGLLLYYMPYILAIVLVLAAAFFFLTKKKNNRSFGEGL